MILLAKDFDLLSCLVIVVLVAEGLDEPPANPSSTESRAVAFLVREVPRWSRDNHCYSCHNNGDAARALYQAARAGFPVPEAALVGTTRWLIQPEGWDHNGGDGPISDKGLARVAFSTALAAAIEARRVPDRSVLMTAAQRLSLDQAADGSWPIEGEDATGSPATYGRLVATLLARGTLVAAQPTHFRDAINRADHWLMSRDVSNVTGAAVILQVTVPVKSPDYQRKRRQCLDLLERAQGDDGGWGLYLKSPSEPFDTALVLLALSACDELAESVRPMVLRGRKFLMSEQRDDGSWIETTRPPGNVSYAQRISTTGWATLGLLATRPTSTVTRPDPKR